MRRFILILAITVSPLLARSQSAVDSSQSPQSSTSVTIAADRNGAIVLVNGDSVGITPVTIPLTPGQHRVRLVPPDVSNWLSEAVDDSISVDGTPSQEFRYTIPRKRLILSTPAGAAVMLGDSVLGTTPLVIKAANPLTLRKPGFEEFKIDIHDNSRSILSFQLKETWRTDSLESIFRNGTENGSSVHLYIAGGVTVLAGAASAYLKVKADNTFSEYIQTGDPARLREVNRLDTGAGIALAVTQIGLGLFTYFILSE